MNRHRNIRIPRMFLSGTDLSVLHPTPPWIHMWWSAALPGLGHFCQGHYFKGLVLMSWEIIINFKARLNEAILYTFTGQFTRAAEVLNTEWALFYGVIFGFTIFDSYRIGVELNILSRMEKGQPRRHYQLVHMSAYSFNYLDRGNPWAALAWSALFTGFGHLYNNKALKSVILVAWMASIIHFSHLNSAIVATFNGNFPLAREVVDYQWLLFFRPFTFTPCGTPTTTPWRKTGYLPRHKKII